MKKVDKIVFGFVLLVVLIASFLGLEVCRIRDQQALNATQYNIEHTQILADSVIVLNKQINALKRNAIKEYIKTENLKTNRNETINSIDTLSTNYLYHFFTEQF